MEKPVNHFVDLKPDTPSGRLAAKRTIKKYTEGIPGSRTKVVFYDPKKFK